MNVKFYSPVLTEAPVSTLTGVFPVEKHPVGEKSQQFVMKDTAFI